MAYRDYSTAVSHIVDSTGQGDFLTIAEAVAAASSGNTIFVRPGSYTETITWKEGVNLSSYACDALSQSVTVTGQLTFSYSGTASISGIHFVDNGLEQCLVLSGSNATVLNLSGCYLTTDGSINIFCNNTNPSSLVNLFSCVADHSTIGGGIISCSSVNSSQININNCYIENSSGSSTSVELPGTTICNINNSTLFSEIDTGSDAVLNIFNCTLNNQTGFGWAGNVYASNTSFILGSSSQITIFSPSVTTLAHCDINGSAGSLIVIGPSATLNFAFLSFSGSSFGVSNSGTLTPLETLV